MRNFDLGRIKELTYDLEIVNMLGKIREYKGKQAFFMAQKPDELEELIEIAKIQSTESSNRIEGIQTGETRIKNLLQEKTAPRNRDEAEILGYRNVLNTIHESHDYIPISPSTILQLHRDLMAPAGLSYGGKYKNVQNYINVVLDDGKQETLFTPIAPYETPEAVEKLCAAYNMAIQTEQIDPLILIPVFISDFLCIHPFNDGNGRMSRLLMTLLLYQNGFLVGKYMSLEKKIELTKDRYYQTLMINDAGWEEGLNDPRPFIKYILQILLAAYVDLEERLQMLDNRNTGSSVYSQVRHYIVHKSGKITSADISNHLPWIGRSSIAKALKTLTEEGFLKKHGVKKGTFYTKAED